jgi:hypothetical protein
MNCPNCGVYNPEDRTVCWRCDKELPKPKPKKTRNPQSSQIWLYVIIAIFLIFTLAQTCGVKTPFSPQTPQQDKPSGYLAPHAPLARWIDVPWPS